VASAESIFSDEVAILIHPLSAHESVARIPVTRGDIVARLARLLLVLGAFVSFTAAGRLVAFHVVSPTIFWAFIPGLQLAFTAFVARLFVGPDAARIRLALTLHLASLGGWMLLLLSIAALCILSPAASTSSVLLWLLGRGVLPAVVLVTFVHGIIATYGLFSRGLALSRGDAARATGSYYLGYAFTLAAYYLVTGQLRHLF
jgi:hypothetical protein